MLCILHNWRKHFLLRKGNVNSFQCFKNDAEEGFPFTHGNKITFLSAPYFLVVCWVVLRRLRVWLGSVVAAEWRTVSITSPGASAGPGAAGRARASLVMETINSGNKSILEARDKRSSGRKVRGMWGKRCGWVKGWWGRGGWVKNE